MFHSDIKCSPRADMSAVDYPKIFSLFRCDETPPHNHTPQSASYERNTTCLALNMPPPPVTTPGYKTPPGDLMSELSSSDCEANGEVSGEQRKYYFRSSRVRSPDITHMTPATYPGWHVEGWRSMSGGGWA